MKKIVALLVALVSLCSVASASNAIFAFEDAIYSVIVGQTVKPKAVSQGISGKLSYVWQSSNEDVATVNGGTVKGVSGGTTVVTCKATTEEGREFVAECTVQVIVPIISIKAEKAKVEIALAPFGTSSYYEWGRPVEEGPFMYKPVLTFTPADATNQTIEWKSANPNIASVAEDGTIFGESSGTTTITGKATDGSGKTVKIEVKVPACYVTEDNITITDPAGATIGYIQGSSGGITTFNIKTSGGVITYDPLEEVNGMDYLQLIPLKAGEGTLSFLTNGRTVKTVKINVEHSAVFDNVSYPAVKISKLLNAPEESIGTKTQVKCEIIKVIPQRAIGARGGIVYGMLNEDGERRYVIFEYEYAQLYEVGDTQTIYGTVSDFVEYVTETGLTYTCPYFTGGHINRY